MLALILGLLMLASHVQAQTNHIPLSVNGNSVENSMNEKGVHYYKINIGEEYQRDKDLLISIKGTDVKSDPDLHISSTNQTPSSLTDSEYSCAMVGEDICTIPASALSRGKTFFVAAK